VSWKWCEHARDRCHKCGAIVTGVWWFFTTPTSPKNAICGPCAEALEEEEQP
jgi:hypothetical protein